MSITARTSGVEEEYDIGHEDGALVIRHLPESVEVHLTLSDEGRIESRVVGEGEFAQMIAHQLTSTL